MPDVAQVLAGDPAQVLAPAPAPVALPMGVEERKRRAKIAEALAMQSMDVSPVQSWTQGAARVANGLVGALEERKLDQGERASADRLNKLLLSNPALGGSGGAAPAVAAPAADATPAPAAPATGEPRGLRNANPLNIEDGPFAQSQPGYAGNDGRFAKFASLDQGVGASGKLLDTYQQKYGLNTVRGIIGRWAPATDGNNVDAYVGNVSKILGVDPDAPLTPEMRPQLIAAMTQHENGKPLPSATPANPAGSSPPPAAPGVPAALSAAFQPGTPSMAAPTPQNAPAAAAGPAAAVAAPGAPAPAAARMQTAMDPQMQGYVRLLLASRDPGAMAMAQKIMEQYSKPAELKPMIAGTKGYTFDPATGRWTQAVDADKPKYTSFEGGRVLEEGSGKVTTPDSAAGFRPLVAPEDRAKFGIPATDPRPYQVDAGGKLINPPAETRVNIDQKAEGSFENHAGQLQATRFNDLVKQGYDAKAMIADLSNLRDLGSRIPNGTGKTAEFKAAIGPYADVLGVKVDGLSDMQAYNAVVAKLQPRMRVAGSGSTSDYEMRQFLAALPSLGKTPEGNAIIANTLEALQQQHLAAGDIASRALAGEKHGGISRMEGEKQLRELPDPFQLWKQSHGGKAPSAPQKTSSGVNWSVE